jgi:predicted RND superfamily exporter protein
MLNAFIRRTVDFCIRHRWLVIGFGIILGALSATYAERRFGIRLALQSLPVVAAVLVSLLIGFAVTAAAGLFMVGSLNPISIAFAVLCIGLGVDFAIQFSVRYRAARHENDDVYAAVLHAAERVGVPLTVAAAAGFLSFIPTSYRGLAELGLISGCGMVNGATVTT